MATESVIQQKAHVERFRLETVLKKVKEEGITKGEMMSLSDLITFFDEAWATGTRGKQLVSRIIYSLKSDEKRALRRAVNRREMNEKLIADAGRTKR